MTFCHNFDLFLHLTSARMTRGCAWTTRGLHWLGRAVSYMMRRSASKERDFSAAIGLEVDLSRCGLETNRYAVLRQTVTFLSCVGRSLITFFFNQHLFLALKFQLPNVLCLILLNFRTSTQRAFFDQCKRPHMLKGRGRTCVVRVSLARHQPTCALPPG